MKRRKQGKKNVLIAFLIAAVFMMSVGYAALASQLEINGVSKITGNFKVEITSISDGVAVGDATNAVDPKFTNTTADFEVNLVSPGDSMTYEIVVKNTGNLVAKLDSITGVPEYNGTDPIKYTVTGVEKDETLAVNAEKTVTVKVEYVSTVESQPSGEELSKSLSMTLNYIQSK